MYAKLTITDNAQRKIKALVLCNNKEIGFYGEITRISELVFRLEDIFVYPQKVTETSIDCDDAKFAKWQAEKMKNPTLYQSLRLHGHSHVNMQVHPSSTDLKLQKDITEQMKNGDFFIFIIVNKYSKIWMRTYYKKDDTVSKLTTHIECESVSDWADAQTIRYVKGDDVWTYENQ